MPEIAGNTFEGLFVHALKVKGPVVEDFKAIGFDPTRLETSYPVKVWRDALRVAAKEYYAALSYEDAEYQLGVKMVAGYLTTLVGRVIQAALPFLKADTMCLRLPRYFSTGIVGGENKPPIVSKLGERHYETTLYGEGGVPYFTAGAIDTVLRLTKVKPVVKVARIEEGSFTVDITWAV